MANAVFHFPGGVVVDTSTVESLRQSASEWRALATVHQDEAERAADAGDFETARQQMVFAQASLGRAIERYVDARQLQREAGE